MGQNDEDYIKGEHFRADADMVPGQRGAQDRLTLNQNLLWSAWRSLDLFPFESAEDYLAAPLKALCGDNEEAQRKVLKVILMFAMVAVEADRAHRRDNPERPL